jgi:hypothetical protein
MTTKTPNVELDKQFSSPDATAVPWKEAEQHLDKAEVYWLSTVRPDRRPHITPLIAVWLSGALGNWAALSCEDEPAVRSLYLG